MHEEKHKIWELRHSACKKCHGESEDPCICGPEPCKKCGYNYGNVSLKENADGCDKCSPPESDPKIIDVESTWMMLCVSCPYCDSSNLIDGNNTMGGFDGDALECHSCSKRSWLGEDAPYEYDNDITSEHICLNKGKPVT